MTRLYDPAPVIQVEANEEGQPIRVRALRPDWTAVDIVRRWVVDVDWWAEPVQRDYWQVILGGGVLADIFRDRADGTWHLERVYD